MSDAAVATGPSAGALLRQAREAAGLHVAALAVSLKVPVRKLEALEDDRYDQLTDAVFARALASSVCRTLKIDPHPVLARLPQSSAPRLVPDHEGIGAPFRAPGDAPGPGWSEHLKRPVTLAVGSLLIGAVVILLLPSFRTDEAPVAAAQPETPAVAMAQAVVVPAGTPGSTGTVTSEPVPVSLSTNTAVPAATPSPAETVPSSRPAGAPVMAAPSAAVTPAVAAPAAPSTPTPAAAAADGIVVFKANGPSWVEVTDREGRVALRRLLAAGESAGASGTLPLAVTIGSVSATAVEVRGKPFNLAPVSRDNVARFEIK